MGNTSNCYHSYLTDTIYFSFSLLYFYRASGFLSPFARRKYHKVCTQFSLYLPYFLTLLIEPHAADFLSPAAWGTHQIVILYILSISILFFHFPYCISTVRADSFPRSHGGNTTRYTSNFTYTYLIFNFLYLSPMRLTSFLRPHGEHIKLLTSISNSLI